MKHDPDLIDLVRQLKGEGARHTEIARATGMTVEKITGLCHRHNIRRPPMLGVAVVEYPLAGVRRPSEGRLNLPLGPRLVQALQAEADRRKQPLVPFMTALLRHMIDDNLFTAILDDGK